MATCPVCLELFNATDRAPHALLCGHEYCAACLATLLKEGTIVCPQDRAATRTGSVSSLPRGPSFVAARAGAVCDLCEEGEQVATHFCHECEVHMCEADTRKHAIPKSNKYHYVVLLAGAPDPVKAPRLEVFRCPTHNEDLKFFDVQCKITVCGPCLSLEHHGHKCTSLKEAADIVRKDVGKAIEAWTSLGEQARAAEDRVRAVHGKLKGNVEQARAAARQLCAEVSYNPKD